MGDIAIVHYLDTRIRNFKQADEYIHRFDSGTEVVLPILDFDHIILRADQGAERQQEDQNGKNCNNS
jgi:hypothetical protein